jgi:hypothetical protein
MLQMSMKEGSSLQFVVSPNDIKCADELLMVYISR